MYVCACVCVCVRVCEYMLITAPGRAEVVAHDPNISQWQIADERTEMHTGEQVNVSGCEWGYCACGCASAWPPVSVTSMFARSTVFAFLNQLCMVYMHACVHVCAVRGGPGGGSGSGGAGLDRR